MNSTLIKANIKGKTPTQMIKDLKAYNKYAESHHSEAELAQKAKKLQLTDGLPFTYCFCDKPAYGSSVVSLDLRSLEAEYEQIYFICQLLAPHSPVIGVPKYTPHPFRPERKSGVTRLTDILCNQLKFIHESVTTIEHSITHDHKSTMENLLKLDDSTEKVRLIGKLSTLTRDFRRNYFSDIPFLLEIVAAEPGSDFYLFNYKGSFDDQDLVDDEAIELLATEDLQAQATANGIERKLERYPEANKIRKTGIEAERLRAEGADLSKEVDVVLAEAKQVTKDPVTDYFVKQGLSPTAAAKSAAETTELIGGLKAATKKTDASLQALKDSVSPPAKPATTAKIPSGAKLSPEDLDGTFAQTRKMLKDTMGLEAEEISLKFPGGFATKTF
jgi:hypothetical protein